MIWVRKGFVNLLTVVLLFSLLGAAGAVAFNQTLGKPDKVKQLLADAKVYERTTGAFLETSQTETLNNGGDSTLALNSATVKRFADQAFPAALVQSSADTFIDAHYAWLSGETALPEFTIDVTAAKQDFADRVGANVATRLEGLSVCTNEQVTQLQIPIDPLSVTCRPPNLDPKTEGARVTAEIINGEFLENSVITPETLNQNDEGAGAPYYKQLSWVPAAFQIGQNGPVILGALAVLSALGVIFIHVQRRKGIRRTGIVLLVAGLLLIIFKFMTDSLANRFESQVLSGTASQLEQPQDNFLSSVSSQIAQTNLKFGLVFIALALIILIALAINREGRSRKPKATPTPDTLRAPSAATNKPSPISYEDEISPLPPRQPSATAGEITDRIRVTRPSGPPKLPTQPINKPQPTKPKRRKPPRLVQ